MAALDWPALVLSLELAAVTMIILLPIGVALGRTLAWRRFAGRRLVEATLMLPLVLPPTVLGFYLLIGFQPDGPLGRLWAGLVGAPLAFGFEGLAFASVIANLPFAIQPMLRGFEAIPPDVREAAACCGMGPWKRLAQIELPLAWPGVVTGMVLTFAHTLGEFGVVLMVGGAIPGETRTAAIAIYDQMQAFDTAGAAAMSAVLLSLSLAALLVTLTLSDRVGRARA
jgi:molybdate transport system permease protein